MSKDFKKFTLMDETKSSHATDSTVFTCKIPDCPHCLEDIAQMEDDDLTDDEWLIKEKHKEIEATAIDFADWISKNDWMSIWVEDKWMWEYQSSEYFEELPHSHKFFGYKTSEQLFELYKASKL